MKRTISRLLAIESPFPEAHSMLRFLEPPNSCPNTLWERLFKGTYDKPFIVDTGRRRFLHFDLDAVQSAMEMARPQRLSLAYTRKMMSFLLFQRAPKRILLLGLGGGSLAKFCYGRLPNAAVTAVEVNSDVIALRDEFCIPADDERFRVIRADGHAYIADLDSCKDVILADACDRAGVAPQLNSVEFYQDARKSLAPGGVFVINLCGPASSCAAHVAKLRTAFEDEFLTLRVRADGNVIAFAFRDHRPEVSWEALEAQGADLAPRFGLDFPRYVRRMARDWKLRRWQPVFP